MNKNPYGFCPHCGVPGFYREKKPIGGKDTCENGHIYLSSQAVRLDGSIIVAINDALAFIDANIEQEGAHQARKSLERIAHMFKTLREITK